MAQGAAARLIEQGIGYAKSEKNKQATSLLNQGLERAQATNNYYLQARALLWLGECAFMERDYTRTCTLTNEAKQIADDHLHTDTVRFYFTILQNLGVCHSYLGRLDVQRSFYRRALTFQQRYFSTDDRMRADAYSNLSAAYYRTFMLDSALFWFDSTLLIAKEELYPDLRAIVLLNKGKIHAYLHDYDQAIRHQQEALRLSNTANERILGHSHLVDYFQEAGRSTRALSHLDSARALIEQRQKSKQQYYSMVELKACQLYRDMGDMPRFRSTLANLLNFLPHQDENFIADHCRALQLQAEDQILQGAYEKAIQTAEQALQLVRQQQHPELIVACYQLLAEALAEQGRYQQSLNWIQKGLTATTPGYDDLNLMTNPPIAQLENLEYSLPLLEAKIEYFRRWYDQRGRFRHLEGAMAAQQSADSLLIAARRGMRSQQSRRILAKQLGSFQRASMMLYYRLYERKGERKWLDAAFTCAERGRSMLIAENLSAQAAMRAIIPDDLRTEEQQLSERLQYLRLKLAQSDPQDRPNRSKWQQELYDLSQRWDRLLSTLEVRYPKYHELKYRLPFADIHEVQQEVLSANEVMLSFTDLDDAVLCLGLSRDSVFFKLLPMSSSLRQRVPALRALLLARSSEYYQKAYELFQELLAPSSSFWRNKQLVLIPDGSLWYIPFNALPTRAGGRRAYQQQFLIEEVNMRWLYAAHLALPDTGNISQRRRFNWLGFAPFGKSVMEQNLSILPGSVAEVEQIAQYLDGLKQHTFINKYGTKENFLSTAPYAQVLHLSSHALSNREEPLLSTLFFHSRGRKQNGSLYASEAATLNIPADLVVLSACETQAGKLEGGEGVAGWAQSFSLAGARGLLASAWSVNDDTGPVLIKSFYRQLQQGDNKAKAYSSAQRLYLSESDALTLHPYFWAGFVYIGDNEPIHWEKLQEDQSPYLHTSLLIIVLLLVLLLLVAKLSSLFRKQV